MYYRIYLDQLFLEEMLMLVLVLRICGTLTGIQSSWGRTWLVSGMGAAAECFCLVFQIGGGKIGRGITAVVLTAFCAGFGFSDGRQRETSQTERKKFKKGYLQQIIRRMIVLLVSAGLLEGLLQSIISIWELPVLLAAVFSFMAIELLIRRRRDRMVLEEYRTEVTLEDHGDRLVLTGLIDTGNHLREPMTGRPVSILDRRTAQRMKRFQMHLQADGQSGLQQECKDIFEAEEQKGILFIPYHTVGEEKGWMWGMTVDTMYIRYRGEEIRINKPVLAVSGERLSRTDQYQIIVNPLEVCVR